MGFLLLSNIFLQAQMTELGKGPAVYDSLLQRLTAFEDKEVMFIIIISEGVPA